MVKLTYFTNLKKETNGDRRDFNVFFWVKSHKNFPSFLVFGPAIYTLENKGGKVNF